LGRRVCGWLDTALCLFHCLAWGCGVDFVIIFAIFLPPVTILIAWPVFGAAFSRVGLEGLFFTVGGFSLIYLNKQA
jgi:hypothetical protein